MNRNSVSVFETC